MVAEEERPVAAVMARERRAVEATAVAVAAAAETVEAV